MLTIAMATFFRRAPRLSFLLVMAIGIGGCGPRFKCPPKPDADPRAQAFAERGGKDSAKWGQSGVQDAQIAIDPACSTYCYEFFGEGWQAPVFGTLDVTIDPACTAPTCTFTIDNIRLTSGDVTLPGHSLTDVRIVGDPVRYQRGLWSDENVFFMNKLSFSMYTEFNLDGIEYAQIYINDENIVTGTLNHDYSHFSFSGQLIRTEDRAVNFELCGHPVARPPMPVITPRGSITADESGVAHVTFSSSQSSDPDGDIDYSEWRIDNLTFAIYVNSVSVALPVGKHEVSLRMLDRRGVARTITEIVTVEEK